MNATTSILAVGSGAYVAAIFHMVTHAFFKALLFLGAGSVIHGLHEEQDMKRMGALRRWMPVTAATFIAAWLAIAGVPPFSGFWSKDDILLAAYEKSVLLWAVGLVTALLTAYYMSRQVFLVFYGEARWQEARPGGEAAHQAPHESPRVMTIPLVVLGALSLVGGAINLPFGKLKFLEHWLEPVFEETLHHVKSGAGVRVGLAALAVGASLTGVAAAYTIFERRRRTDALEPALLQRAWGVDELYSALVERPGRAVSGWVADVFDARVVDGAVNGVAGLVRATGSRMRAVQTGYVRNYALGVTFGAVALLGYVMVRGG